MRIVIGEDSVLFREGLARLLADAGHDVVGKSPDATALIETVRTTSPDLAVIDVRMPPDLTDDGARAAWHLRETFPELGIVLLSQHVEARHSVELAAAGRFGYLLKDRVFDVTDFLARKLWLSQCTVETHISSVLAKLSIHDSDEDHRRVLAVLAYLGQGGRAG